MSKYRLERLSEIEALRGLGALVTPFVPGRTTEQPEAFLKEIRPLPDGGCVLEFSISKRAYFKMRPRIRQIRKLMGDASLSDGDILALAIAEYTKKASRILHSN